MKNFFTLFKTLRGFVVAAIMTVTLFVFLGVTLAASILYENIFTRQAQQTSKSIADHTFSLMFEIMSQGWTREELEHFISTTKAAYQNSPFEFEIYRSDKVSELYGVINQRDADTHVEQLFAGSDAKIIDSANHTRRLFPLNAEQACLGCHTNAAIGDALGVIEIVEDKRLISDEIRRGHLLLFIICGILTLIVSLIIANKVARRINLSMDHLRTRLESVNTVTDFKHLDISDVDFYFEEFNNTFSHIRILTERLKDVAVDKDILEFEIRLLSKFIITSEVVKDWRDFIKDLLIDINSIITAHTLVTIFQIEEEGYELEVFWHHDVCQKTQSDFEAVVSKQLASSHHYQKDCPILKIVHHIARPSSAKDSDKLTLGIHEIELQTKSLLLETPKIGGVVGIGVQSEMARDPIRHIVIDSILTTLLNLVGSVKAIYKYTKDLEYYATRDPLTDLHNQRMFHELLGYEVGRSTRHNQEFSLLMLDLDNFKHVNDRYGHSFGDQFLHSFARVLDAAVRPGDFVSRYGGDEFTIILPETSEEQAHSVAQRIASSLETLVLTAPDGSKVRGTTSIGIAIYPRHAADPRDLFVVADNMMYKAKREGKNQIAIPNEDEMAEVFKAVGEKNLMVLNALEEKRIVPYFQPILDVQSKQVKIHELLMRIDLGDRIISAVEFIDIAESIGVVHKMDYLLIEKAFEQMNEQTYDGMLFINLSPKSLIIGEFISRVRQLALEHSIHPSRIVFELTERETVSNMALLEKFVQDLKLEGFNFAIDDFGSGFSSFHYIKHFPIDVIKIEGDFVRNMLTDTTDLAFVKSIVTLAQGLNIKTVAEFVEDENIMEAIRAMGIDYGQGYYIGKPSPKLVKQVDI
ncbi:putative bifunctional diguanylate cyclase/phosphodiesterase [Nitrincola tibetensis]|nr:bifunctional diguanylate cyclase/phosphodiesterase [Nitrincola tibetensis]